MIDRWLWERLQGKKPNHLPNVNYIYIYIFVYVEFSYDIFNHSLVTARKTHYSYLRPTDILRGNTTARSYDSTLQSKTHSRLTVETWRYPAVKPHRSPSCCSGGHRLLCGDGSDVMARSRLCRVLSSYCAPQGGAVSEGKTYVWRMPSLFVLAVISPLFNETINWMRGVMSKRWHSPFKQS